MRSFFFFAAFVIGCSGGDFTVGNGVAEDGSVDSGGSVDDTGGLADSSVTDSATDSGKSEAGGEGGVSEGGVKEGGVVEAGTCPKPPSTKTYNFTMLGCDALQ